MSEEEKTVKEPTTEEQTQRPAKRASRAKSEQRPKRVPVSGFRNILGIHGRDPEFEYRWVSDTDESGERIQRHLFAGYDFVSYNEINGVGQERVGNATDLGSIVTKPGGGQSADGKPLKLYLMKVPKEYYDEDQKRKVDETVEVERRMREELASSTGHYGNIDIKYD